MSNILQRLRVFPDHLELTFKVTLQTASIESSAFLLESKGDTPTQVTFKSVNLREHFDSVARVLRIYYVTKPKTGYYTITITGLKRANGSTLPSETLGVDDDDYDIEYPYVDSSPSVPSYEPVAPIDIKDMSIRREAFISTQKLRTANPYFYVVETDPASDAIYIDDDYERGRISITFSERPAPQFLNSKFIKVQKKDVTKIGRWETLPINISINTNKPIVYLDIPSLDATPVFNTEGSQFFEENFKYRVRLSKEIGA